MIEMPESYDSICRKKGFLAETLYNLLEMPDRRSSWYQEANVTAYDYHTGIFQLYYILRSFVKPTDDRWYWLYFVAKDGIYRACNPSSHLDEPLDFSNITCKKFSHFGMGDFITLAPDTRKIVLAHNYRFTELIDGVGYPNTFNFFEHSELKDREHKILLESDNLEPIVMDFNPEMYHYIRRGEPYIWVRYDNYVPLENVRFNRQPY